MNQSKILYRSWSWKIGKISAPRPAGLFGFAAMPTGLAGVRQRSGMGR